MNYVLPEVQVNYREAHPKFSGRVHQHHSLRRNLRQKVRRDDALRTFEIVLRSVKRGKELDSRRNQQQMSVEILLDKKRKEGEGEGRA